MGFRYRMRSALIGLSAAATIAAQACHAPPRHVPTPAPAPVAAPVRVAPVPSTSPESTFGRLHARLSEPGGFFQSENVVSNETSYLHVLDAMRRIGVRGGAYIGVGPDQNYSY